MIELLQLDELLFRWINGDLHHPILDMILPYWRNKYFWIPLYVFIIGFLIINYKKKGLIYLLVFLTSIGISDISSSHLIKKNVQRIRPCNNVELKNEVKLLVPCGAGYSFTSSHACNHFTIAMFMILTLGIRYRWIKLPLFLWAATIAFAQVYVGVHYPLDVGVGMLLGIMIASLMASLYWRLDKDKLLFER